jgi:hypothetical protein
MDERVGVVTGGADHNQMRTRKHVLLLSLWQEHPSGAWRASVQATGSSERRGFATVEYLVAYLLQLTGPDGPELEGSLSTPDESA